VFNIQIHPQQTLLVRASQYNLYAVSCGEEEGHVNKSCLENYKIQEASIKSPPLGQLPKASERYWSRQFKYPSSVPVQHHYLAPLAAPTFKLQKIAMISADLASSEETFVQGSGWMLE
jgi:hypothetical protein